MNKPMVLFHLRGAREMLEQIIKDVEAGKEHDGFPEFYAQLPFVYRNLNRAWNIRFKADDEIAKMSKHESEGSYRFPHDLSPFISD